MTFTEQLLRAMPLLAAQILARPDYVLGIRDAADLARIPRGMLVAVCALESGLGRARGAWCGVTHPRGVGPVDQPRAAAQILARMHRVCGSWPRALAAYRWGACGHPDTTGYVRRALALAERVGP